jgi:hypothetical protein
MFYDALDVRDGWMDTWEYLKTSKVILKSHSILDQAWWLIHVIPATQKVEIGRITV